jgi:hypothetical protein
MSNKISKSLWIAISLISGLAVLLGLSFTPTTWALFAATPINDLGTGLYLNQYQGGLYENGTNTVPSDHNTAGLTAAGRIQPLDGNGNPNASGKIVLLSIGMSNTSDEWCGVAGGCTVGTGPSFMVKAAADSAVNHASLVIVNGAEGGQAADSWTSPTDPNYTMVANRLASAGVTENQVQAIWLKQAHKMPTVSLPSTSADAYTLETDLGSILRAIKVRYPHIQAVFLSSRIYAGYATSNLNPEPYAYESGFSVKWLIQAQINQIRTGNIDPTAGDLNYNTVAPWITWAPYPWASGTTPRSDGLIWVQSDFQSDGTHPATSGIDKVATMLMSFFKTSPYTQAWFTVGGATPTPTRTNTPSGPTATPTRTPTRTNTPIGPTSTPTRTNTPSGSIVIHVAALLTTDVNNTPKDVFLAGETLYWRARIVDQGGSPVSGATVSTKLTRADGSVSPIYNAVTNADGWAFFSQATTTSWPKGAYSVQVTNVAKTGTTYDPAQNVGTPHAFTVN